MAKELTYDQLKAKVEKLEVRLARRKMTKRQRAAEARRKAAARAKARSRFKSRFSTRRSFTGRGSGPCQGGLCAGR
jgi:hypothetical protein